MDDSSSLGYNSSLDSSKQRIVDQLTRELLGEATSASSSGGTVDSSLDSTLSLPPATGGGYVRTRGDQPLKDLSGEYMYPAKKVGMTVDHHRELILADFGQALERKDAHVLGFLMHKAEEAGYIDIFNEMSAWIDEVPGGRQEYERISAGDNGSQAGSSMSVTHVSDTVQPDESLGRRLAPLNQPEVGVEHSYDASNFNGYADVPNSQQRSALIAEAMEGIEAGDLALSQFREYPIATGGLTPLELAVISDYVGRRRSRGKRNPARARKRSRQSRGRDPKLLPRTPMRKWQYEVSLRGHRFRGTWVWSWYDVQSFCKLRGGAVAKAFLAQAKTHGVVYRQVQLYFLATHMGGRTKYIHASRRDLNWTPWGYKKVLIHEIRKLLY